MGTAGGRNEESQAEKQALFSNFSGGGKKGSDAVAIASALLVALGPISIGFSLGFSSPTQKGITESLNLDLAQFSFFGSLVTLGAMTGAVVSGKIAGYAGRKAAIGVAAIPHIIGWLLIAFSPDTHTLYLGRFLVGLGVGMISFTVPVYIAEVSPHQLRGILGSVVQLSVTIGIVLAYLGGLLLDWRILAGVGVIPCSFLAVGLIFIPESPRWLANVGGHDEELAASLQYLRGQDCDIADEMFEIKSSVEEAKLHLEPSFSALGERRVLHPLLIAVGLHVLQQFGGISAVSFYSSSILQSAGFPDPNTAALGLSLIQVITCCVSAVLMDKAGRRPLLLISAGGMAVSTFLVGFSFFLKEQLRFPSQYVFSSYLSLAGLVIYIMSFVLGMGPVPWIIMSEIFPANIRAVGGSLAVLANWSSAWMVTMFFNFLLRWSSPGSFWLFSGESVLTFIFVALFVPETRGRTLEEIESSFN